MVFALVLLTVAVLLVVDYILRREDNEIREIGREKKSPIFLSPEKSLQPLENGAKKMYHQSHSWIQPSNEGYVYIGFDSIISTLFTSDVRIDDLPLVGSHIPQGTKIWEVGIRDHKVTQLAPVSGKVIDINPACKLNVPMPTPDIEKSWIIKMRTDDLNQEANNLIRSAQANMLNVALKDELILFAQKGNYLNDGGRIDPEYIAKMPEDEWQILVNTFFPYQSNM